MSVLNVTIMATHAIPFVFAILLQLFQCYILNLPSEYEYNTAALQ